ncbi:MAG: hypothetical protein WBG66_16970 [Geitlerinemataceae cyanobacterium]
MNLDRSLQTVPATPVQDNPQPNHQIKTVLGYVAVALPIVLVLSVIGYRRYRTHVFKQQIAKLERMWRLSPQSKI